MNRAKWHDLSVSSSGYHPVGEVIDYLGRVVILETTAVLERLLDSEDDFWKFRAAEALLHRHHDEHPRATAVLTALGDKYPEKIGF